MKISKKELHTKAVVVAEVLISATRIVPKLRDQFEGLNVKQAASIVEAAYNKFRDSYESETAAQRQFQSLKNSLTRAIALAGLVPQGHKAVIRVKKGIASLHIVEGYSVHGSPQADVDAKRQEKKGANNTGANNTGAQTDANAGANADAIDALELSLMAAARKLKTTPVGVAQCFIAWAATDGSLEFREYLRTEEAVAILKAANV